MTTQLCYLNGEFLPLAEARVSVLDRGFLFGDGVYEVIPVYDGVPFYWRQHFVRLRRSLRQIRLSFDVEKLYEPLCQLVAGCTASGCTASGGGGRGLQGLYIQITRGAVVASPQATVRRQQPPSDIHPTLFMMCNPHPPPPPALLEDGIACVTMEDFRWRRGDIKSVSLLAAVMLAEDAAARGAVESILLRDGILTEGGSCNYIVVQNGEISAPRINADILSGITCRIVLQLARQMGYSVTQRDIERAELAAADEIWLTSSLREILPVTLLDGAPLGSGRAGGVFQKMLAAWRKKTGLVAP